MTYTQVEAESDEDGIEDDEEIENEVPKSTTARSKRAAAARFAIDISRLLQAPLSFLIAIRKRTRGLLPMQRRNRRHWTSGPLAPLLGGRPPGQQPEEREGRWLTL